MPKKVKGSHDSFFKSTLRVEIFLFFKFNIDKTDNIYLKESLKVANVLMNDIHFNMLCQYFCVYSEEYSKNVSETKVCYEEEDKKKYE